jgi:hypothetical protein
LSPNGEVDQELNYIFMLQWSTDWHGIDAEMICIQELFFLYCMKAKIEAAIGCVKFDGSVGVHQTIEFFLLNVVYAICRLVSRPMSTVWSLYEV